MNKTCTKCGVSQSIDGFHKDKTRKDGIFPQCKVCRQTYRDSERGKILHRANVIRNQKTPKGRVRVAKSQKRYQQSIKGAAMYRSAARRHLERKRHLDAAFTIEMEHQVYKRFQDKCFACNETDNLQIDHHYPLSSGYSLTLDNAVLLCRSCNASKGSRHPDKFYTPGQLNILLELLL